MLRPGKIHVLVRRVVRRRPPLDGPMRRRVDVAHVDGERRERPDVSSRSLGEQRRDEGALGRFPGEAGADVDRLHVAPRGFLGEQNRAVQSA